MNNIDIFGDEIIENPLLRSKFKEPPFSILDTKSRSWQGRKRQWARLGMKSEIGRDSVVINMDTTKRDKNSAKYVSIFDPALCEVLYHWFCPDGGSILDPFSGGSVRGIVANYLGFKYTGVDIRQEQIDSNRDQALDILDINNQPSWYVGDSNEILKDKWLNKFDFVFSCPPYANLEVYSDLDGDISNMDYHSFLESYTKIIRKSCSLLKSGGYACFVVGEVRDKKGNFIGFVPDTINAFKECGMSFYNEAILLNMIASASMRASGNMKSKKLVKIHQNVLIFKKTF